MEKIESILYKLLDHYSDWKYCDNKEKVFNLVPYIECIEKLYLPIKISPVAPDNIGDYHSIAQNVISEFTFQQDIRNLIVAMGMMSENLFRHREGLSPIYRDGDFANLSERKNGKTK